MANKTRDVGLDILKLVCALLVCNIHFPLSYNTSIFCDIAVPIFFILSGYFMEKSAQKYSLDQLKSKHISFLLKSFIVILCIVCFQIICNLIMHNTVGMISHLWYLSALVEINFIYYLACKFNFKKAVYFFIFPLLFLNLSLGTYSALMVPTLSLDVLQSSAFLRVSRNALFEGLPFYFMGSFICQYIRKLKRPLAVMLIMLGVVFALLQISENNLAFNANIAGGGHVHITTIFASALLVVGVMGLDIKARRFLPSDLGYYIYILHFPLGKLLGQLVPINSIIVFVISTVLALIICYVKSAKSAKRAT